MPEHAHQITRPQQPCSLDESERAKTTDWNLLADAARHFQRFFYRLTWNLKRANIPDTTVCCRSRRHILRGLSRCRVSMPDTRMPCIRLGRGKRHPASPVRRAAESYVNARQILANEDVLPRWAQQPSQTTFLLSLISATILLSISRELTNRGRGQTILLGFSVPAICALGAAAGMRTLVEVMCFFHQSVALALALSFVLRARDVSVEEEPTFRGKG